MIPVPRPGFRYDTAYRKAKYIIFIIYSLYNHSFLTKQVFWKSKRASEVDAAENMKEIQNRTEVRTERKLALPILCSF